MQQPGILNQLRRMSARVGKNILLTQAAGGNSSIKQGDVLWVKASGAWLADAETQDIFLPISLSGARAALADGNERMPLAPGHAASPLRASIETSLHALMPHPVVLHVHSVNTIAWSVRRDGSDELAGRLDSLAWHWLDYHHPGLPLAQAVSESLAQRPADVLILGNHGLVVGASTCDAAEELVMEVERRLSLQPRIAEPAADDTLKQICAGTEYRPAPDPVHHSLATNPHNLSIATKGSLYPDHVIFLGRAMPALVEGDDLAALAARVAADGLPPSVAVLVRGKGTIIRTDASAAAQALLTCLALVVTRLPFDAAVEYLPPAKEQALLNWDAEHYRQQMTARR
ncbi:MAG TPA: class II aldolase/adducin family protein [Bradyrhizobium sp.]|uniref:class II aldolase/adducin family protein n=1 Tax=Bradyrhizobium sp. TaxID=376 RepID=UPI002CDA2827|nr:class II aldolase/adducin family protein [Bradyrhizobium sp.]HLZ06144.1 class II aldolase/adducin family protein [Bradyrhizobium sp.]